MHVGIFTDLAIFYTYTDSEEMFSIFLLFALLFFLAMGGFLGLPIG